MAQEFTINSSAIESKINQLLPSQGGSGAGIDFSASTMVIPIVDLTESAEGSSVRADLQLAMGFGTTHTKVNNTTTTLVSTTGFYRVFGNSIRGNVNAATATISISDGITSKIIYSDTITQNSVNVPPTTNNFDFIVYLRSGDSLVGSAGPSNLCDLNVTTRQIADVSGNLTNPLGFI